MDIRLISRKSHLVLAAVSILVLSAAPLAMADLGGIDVHGFASQGYMGSDTYNYLTPSKDGSFAISEYAVNVGSDISDDLRIGVQFFARNLGDIGNNTVKVDWAFGDFHRYEWLGIRGGRVKAPYGFYGETADFDHVRTAIFMPQSVYDLQMRDMRTAVNGINPYGVLDLKEGGGLEYSAVYGFTSPSTDGALEKYVSDTGFATLGGQDNEYTFTAQLIWNTPLDGFRLGHTYSQFNSELTLLIDPMIAAMMGIDEVQTMKFDGNLSVSSAEFTYGNITLVGEYNLWETGGENASGFNVDYENWYAQASYRLSAWFEMGTYYSEHYEDKNDRKGENFNPNFRGWQKDLAVSARFDINNNMTFKIEGHYLDGNALVMNMDNPVLVENPSQAERNWYMFASKLSFAF